MHSIPASQTQSAPLARSKGRTQPSIRTASAEISADELVSTTRFIACDYCIQASWCVLGMCVQAAARLHLLPPRLPHGYPVSAMSMLAWSLHGCHIITHVTLNQTSVDQGGSSLFYAPVCLCGRSEAPLLQSYAAVMRNKDLWPKSLSWLGTAHSLRGLAWSV